MTRGPTGFALVAILVMCTLQAAAAVAAAPSVTARRIISLAPHVTELVFAAGAGDRLVGVAEWSDYPPEARGLPRIGRAGRLDVERIHSLSPDLIIGWKGGDPGPGVRALEALGHRVVQTDVARLGDIAPVIREIGRLAGTETVAGVEAARLERDLAALRRKPEAQPLDVFYQIWNRPLMTITDRHFIGDAIGFCGARNVFSGLAGLTATIPIEAVLKADPHLIVGARAGTDGVALAGWSRFGQMKAVARGQLVEVDPDLLHRPTPRIVAGVRALCDAIEQARATRR